MNKRTLKQNFVSIQFFIGILPITLASLIFSYLTYTVESRRKNLIDFQNRQIVSDIQRQIVALESDAEFLLRSSEITEFLLASDVMRPFLENRAYGRILEHTRKHLLRTFWTLRSKDGKKLISVGDLHDISVSKLEQSLQETPPLPSYFTNSDFIVLKKTIRLDDQQQPGPNAQSVGYLFISTPIADLERQFEHKIAIGTFTTPEHIGSLEITFKDHESYYLLFIGFLSAIYLITAFSIIYGIRKLKRIVIFPIETLSQKVLSKVKSAPVVIEQNEIKILESAIDAFEDNLRELHLQKLESEKIRLLEQTARQVSHDIRSPLSALTLLVNTLDQVPEEKRLILRNAASRINDIANTLLGKARMAEVNSKETKAPEAANATVDLIPALVDMLVSEKRVQYRNKIGVEIETDMNSSYGCFAFINQIELKRVLSNLINNSVEALKNENGKIIVCVKGSKNQIHISIQDDGVGIPDHVLRQLGKHSISFGKKNHQSGSGLGILHAQRTIEHFGGTLTIQSSTDHGTVVDIHLPRAKSPSWFVESLDLSKYETVVVVDDDLSIHQIWKNRLQSFPIVNFTSGEAFEVWYHHHPDAKSLFLIDFELLGQPQSGLQLIQKLSISQSSILVTSHYEDDSIRKDAEKLNIRMIPKAMAALIPVHVNKVR